MPRRYRIESNTLTKNDTGALGIQARWVGLRQNTFTGNYWNSQAAAGGGSVFFDQCADTVEIAGNTMTGPSGNIDSPGLELWGRNITVEENNNISGYPSAGVSLNSVYDAKILGPNQITGNGILYDRGGVAVWTVGFPRSCDQTARETRG